MKFVVGKCEILTGLFIKAYEPEWYEVRIRATDFVSCAGFLGYLHGGSYTG